ncbi:MAG: copper amine oxidase N-terminal domain-containing protein, partial [Symbiobacterium sp.]|uniref:stalk domain-containing protein n=1 Tax=Symbiobacterium sp. TaxID=1971213 RepID=UPI0034641304
PLVTPLVMSAVERDGTIAPRTEGRILYVKGVSLEVGKPALFIAGRSQEIDVAPELKEDGIYVPFRWVAELYGGLVEWNQETRTASVTMPWGNAVTVTAGENAYIVNDRTLVPVSVLEQMGIKTIVEGNIIQLEL